MTLAQLLHRFSSDSQFTSIVLLVLGDVALGTLAAIKRKAFQAHYFAAFITDDGLPVLAWFAIYAMSLVNAGTLIDGYGTLDQAQKVMYGALVLRLGASIATSLGDLGIPALSSAKFQRFAGRNVKSPLPDGAGVAALASAGGYARMTLTDDAWPSVPSELIALTSDRGESAAKRVEPAYPMQDGTFSLTHSDTLGAPSLPLDRDNRTTPPQAAAEAA